MTGVRRYFAICLILLTLMSVQSIAATDITIVIDTPMRPPGWALLEQELLRANSIACERFADKYVDSRGYLLHTPRWGTLDGPDDAIETFYNWTLLHALGGSDSVLELFSSVSASLYFFSPKSSAMFGKNTV